MTASDDHEKPPDVTSAETVDAIVEASKRVQDFPLRREFLQRRVEAVVVPGPMGALVKAGDHRALLLFLMLLTKASAPPWNAALPAAAWARALGIDLPESKTARSTISKIWLRLERHGLVSRDRRERLADVFLHREDGLGGEYTSAGEVGENYFRVPLALWLQGPNDRQRWYQVLSLPELTVLLIGRTLGDGFRLPFESGPDWYGVSADTISRGVTGLKDKGMLDVNKRFKKAPLSAVGYTAEHRYTLQEPFGPIGHPSGSRRAAAPPAKTKAKVKVKAKVQASPTTKAGAKTKTAVPKRKAKVTIKKVTR
ncbi:MAG: hypothetical protein WEG56_04305 [Chloroflexota bacterium]